MGKLNTIIDFFKKKNAQNALAPAQNIPWLRPW
jgi:hypothetical protein